MNLRDILVQLKQSINLNKYERPTLTLVATLHNPVGVEKLYAQFVYFPQTILPNTWVKVLVSKYSNPINTDKQFNNQ